MNEQAMTLQPPMGFFEKLRVFAACAVAAGLMWTVGWHVAGPADPKMALTLVAGGLGIPAAWGGLLVLTMVSAAVGTAISGRRLPEAGLFAAAVGLAVLVLRGGSMEQWLGYYPAEDAASRAALMRACLIDSLMWAAILAVAWLTTMVAWRWIGASHLSIDTVADTKEPSAAAGEGVKTPPAFAFSVNGWPALVVTVLVALFFIWMTIARTPVANIARGQVIGSVLAGLFVGAMTARYFTGIEQPHWYVLAPLVVAVIGYLLGYMNADMNWAEASNQYKPYAELAITPPHALARPLPLEYLAIGTVGCLLGYWFSAKVEEVVEKETS